MPSPTSTTFALYPGCRAIFEAMPDESLAFRSAANASVSESRRPLPQRVLRRVHSRTDFRDLFLRVLLAAGNAIVLENSATSAVPAFDSLPALDRFLFTSLSVPGSDLQAKLIWEVQKKLIETPAFAVLLLEAERDSKSWKDLFAKDNGFGDWLKSLSEKLFSKDHPTTRAATAVLGGSMGFLLASRVVLTIVPNLLADNLTLPIHAKIENPNMDITLKDPAQTLSAKLALTLTADPDNKELPLKLKTVEPVKVDFQPVGTVKVKTDFVPSGKTHNAGLGASSTPCCCSDSQSNADSLAKLAAVESHLIAVEKSLDQNQSEDAKLARSLFDKLETISPRVTRMETTLSSVDQDFSNVLATTSITVPENGNGLVFLQWQDEKRKPWSCNVRLDVSRSSNEMYGVSLSPSLDTADPNSECSKLKFREMKLALNEPQSVTAIPYHLTITKASHRDWRSLWLQQGDITLRFQPDARHLTVPHETGKVQNAEMDSSESSVLAEERQP